MRSELEPIGGGTAAAYLQAVRHEQHRFLDAIERARQTLDPADGQLAHVAAIQGRLARQFLDGQRAILRRRAETDQELAAMAADAHQRANGLVAEALQDGVDFDVERLRTIEADIDALAVGRPSVRQDLVAFGTSVVRTSDDARSLAGVLEIALQPDDPDGLTAARQLGSVLDEWWHRANDDAQAQLRDANAGSVIRLHVAAVEVRELLATQHADTPLARVGALDSPTSVPLSSLDTALQSAERAEYAGLHSLLSELESALVGGDLDGPHDLTIREVAADSATSSVSAAEPYDGFWPSRGRRVSPARSWMPTSVVLPMVGLTAGVALVMAWVG